MKKTGLLLGLLALLLSLTACGGVVSGAEVTVGTSARYEEKELRDAVDVAMAYFKKEFSGCTLTGIGYIGDERNEDYEEFARRNGYDDVIVLVSSFDVGPSGGDGSLNPNSTYTGWKWILVRDAGGKWVHVDHGYG